MASERVWTIELPFTKPLSLNGREHWRVKAKKVAEVRQAANLLTRQAKVPQLQHCTVVLHYVPRDKRRRDPLNLVATLKPIEDGIVDAGVIEDDNPKYLTPTIPMVHEPAKTPRLYFEIREINERI